MQTMRRKMDRRLAGDSYECEQGPDELGRWYETSAIRQEDGSWKVVTVRVKHDSPTIGDTQEALISSTVALTDFDAGRLFQADVMLYGNALACEARAA